MLQIIEEGSTCFSKPSEKKDTLSKVKIINAFVTGLTQNYI